MGFIIYGQKYNSILWFVWIGYIPQKVLNKVRDKSIAYNIFRIQDCWFCCIAFIEYLLAGKTLLDCTSLFSPNDYKKNEKIIYKYFKGINMSSLQFKF